MQPVRPFRRRVDDLRELRPDPLRQRPDPFRSADRATLRTRLSEDAECRQRRRAEAILVRNDRETEMASLDAVEALFFTLVGGTSRAEGIFLHEDLPIGSTAVFRDLGRDLLGALAQFFFDLVREPRDRLRPVKFDNNALEKYRGAR